MTNLSQTSGVTNVQELTVGDLITTVTQDIEQSKEYIEEIPRESRLTNTTTMLSISRFELYLTDFSKNVVNTYSILTIEVL